MVYIVLPPELSKRSIQTLVQYMYSGEATVSNDILNEVLRGGELLKIRGLWRNHPSGEPPNALPTHYQPAVASAQQQQPPSSSASNASTSSNKIVGDQHLVYQTPAPSSAAIDRVSCSLSTGPPPPSVVKESPVIVMSPRHASNPPSQLMLAHHQHNGGGGAGGTAGQDNGGHQQQQQHVKRELDYSVEPLSPPPHHGEIPGSMYNVRKVNVGSSGVGNSGSELINTRCKAPVAQQMESYTPENGRDRRYRDDHQDRRSSIDMHHQQPHIHHQTVAQPSAPPRLILRDTEVLRMSNCPPEILHKRRSSFQQHESQQQQQHIHHQHQPIIDHHQIESSAGVDRLATTSSAATSDRMSSNHHHHRVKVTSTTMSSAAGEQHPPIKIKQRDLVSNLPAESMGFLTIKQEPLEWSELTQDNNGGSAAALLLDAKAHIEVTVKPELLYPENEDSCDGGTAGEFFIKYGENGYVLYFITA